MLTEVLRSLLCFCYVTCVLLQCVQPKDELYSVTTGKSASQGSLFLRIPNPRNDVHIMPLKIKSAWGNPPALHTSCNVVLLGRHPFAEEPFFKQVWFVLLGWNAREHDSQLPWHGWPLAGAGALSQPEQQWLARLRGLCDPRPSGPMGPQCRGT